MNPDQTGSLIWVHIVSYIANNMDPDQTIKVHKQTREQTAIVVNGGKRVKTLMSGF